MSRGFEFRAPRMILALVLIVGGAFTMYLVSRTPLILLGSNVTSIALLLGGLVFYSGILVIVAMFKNETYLSIAVLLPSIIAVAIFVYGFIGWSIRVSLSTWKGLNPDYTWNGINQYIDLFNHDQRFLIDLALRQSLENEFPELKKLKLTSYSLNIVDSLSGTAAAARARTEFSDEEVSYTGVSPSTTWATTSVSEDVLDASIKALIDGYRYKLIFRSRTERYTLPDWRLALGWRYSERI